MLRLLPQLIALALLLAGSVERADCFHSGRHRHLRHHLEIPKSTDSMMTPFHATKTGDGPGGDSQEEIELDFLPIPELPELPPESERKTTTWIGESCG